MNSSGFRHEFGNRSSWVQAVAFNGNSITVYTHKGTSFDLLAINHTELEAVKEVCYRDLNLSPGACINRLVRVRNRDGSLKIEEAEARVFA